MANVSLIPADLSPGDSGSVLFNWQGFDITRISSAEAPQFETVYSNLWNEFGTQGEMEQREVIYRRLGWNSKQIAPGFALGYEMISVLKNGHFAAARDHTAIIRTDLPEAIVHLSHVLVDPRHRGTGMIGWLRSWPIQKARSTLIAAGCSAESPITLVAEMEPFSPGAPEQRLKSYQKAGFLMVDPSQVQYHQPDFRKPQEIDLSTGPRPLPLRLVIRRVGHETETEITGGELNRIVTSLYTMYEASFRPQDMTELWKQLQTSYPSENTKIRLVNPRGQK